jgi:hypothetical protein
MTSHIAKITAKAWEVVGKADRFIVTASSAGHTASYRNEDQDVKTGAGDRDRTGDIQLGKLAFYR